MPFIQKTTLPLTFIGGLQDKTDSLTLQPPALLNLENAKFDKIGALNKRPGYDILPNVIVDDGLITEAVNIDSFNKELNLFDNKNIYTYISAMEGWSNRGTAVSLINTNNQIIRQSTNQQLNPDSAFLNGVNLFAWEDSRGTVRYSVVDQNTGSYIINDRAISTSLTKPKTITFNGLFYIFYTSNNILLYNTINPATANVITPAVAIVADGYGSGFTYDCCVSNDRLYVTYFSNSGGMPSIKMFYINTAGTKSFVTTVANGVDAIKNAFVSDTVCITITGDSLDHVWVVWSNGGAIKVSVYDGVPAIPTLITGLSTIGTHATVPMVAAIEDSTDPGAIQVVYQTIPNLLIPQQCVILSVKLDGSINNQNNLLGVGIATKPFTYGGSNYINLAFESPLQSTYFTVLLTTSPFTIVSKVAPQVGGGFRTNHMAAEINEISDGMFLWSNLVKGAFISEDHVSFSILGVNSTTSDFSDINKFNSVTFSNNLLFVGGILQNYDGISVNEQNFHIFPEDIEAQILPGDGALSAGQYQYRAVYAWTDNFGQIQYSTPSPAVTVVTNVNDAVKLFIPTCRLTSKTNVVIKIYRTQVNGNPKILQEVTSEIAPFPSPGLVVNSTKIASVSFVDVLADSEISFNAPIYTNSTVENSAPPSCSMISLYNDRVIIGGLEDPNLLWFSKNKINNSNFNTIPVEFSAAFTIGVNQKGGPITALGLMDQNLIIFKRASIFILSGEGPNDDGGGNNFPDPQLISESVGCINPNSVILTGQGIMFQTPDKGIWLLDRSLGPPQYIGSGVDDLAKKYIISSATLDINSNSVIFTTFNGPALIYDYLIGQWATWTNHQAVDGLIFQNEFTFCKSNGIIYKQNPNIFYDGSFGDDDGYGSSTVPYHMQLVTPWISYSQVMGYQSIFKFFILGQYKGKHTLKVEVGYNFDPSFIKSTVIDATAVAGANLWGGDALWGLSTPWGGDNYGFAGSGSWHPYIFQVNMSVQKCTSFRIRIHDEQVNPYNEGYTINGLLFEVGQMPNGVRVPLANKVGISK